jgi:hypothetical protein
VVQGVPETERPLFWKSHMAVSKQAKSKSTKLAATEPQVPVGPKRVKKVNRKKLIQRLMGRFEDSLDGEAPKATLADFIRLTQLERDLEQQEKPREIVITWKEPPAEKSTET